MKMRASLARVLTPQPGTFLFDEPFGALDEITRERLNDELLHLFEATQFAGLFITHSIAEAVYMSTRVLVMSARPGRIIGDYPVPFPYPREPELRFDPEFAELCGRISESLRRPTHERSARTDRSGSRRPCCRTGARCHGDLQSKPAISPEDHPAGHRLRPRDRRLGRLHYVLNEDKAITVPLPWDVIKVGVFDGTNLSMVLTSLWLSAKSALVGLLVTVVLGLGFAVLMSQAKWSRTPCCPTPSRCRRPRSSRSCR